MKRDINLSLGLSKQLVFKFSPGFLIRTTIAYTVVLVIIWCVTCGSELYQQKNFKKLSAQQESISKKLTDIEKKYALNEKMDEHSKYLTALLKQKGHRYSHYLHDLAAHVPQGVWLESIEVGNGGAFVKLIGKTYNAPLAMILLQNLHTTPTFSNEKFKIFDLTVNAKKNSIQNLSSFTVQTDQ